MKIKSPQTPLFLRGDVKAMTKAGFPIKTFGNDRSVVTPRSLEIIVRDDKAKDEIAAGALHPRNDRLDGLLAENEWIPVCPVTTQSSPRQAQE
jgi:hypothetical protein